MFKIVTHNGIFHCDDVLGHVVLDVVFCDQYQLIRTRNKLEIKDAYIAFDVGGEYDPVKGRFDHHFNDDRLIRKSGVKYSSAGLIWKHFGKQFLKIQYPNSNREEILKIWNSVDERIFEWVDRIDNGQLDDDKLPKNCVTINHMVNSFTPNWNSKKSFDEEFEKCSKWLSVWFFNEVDKFAGQIKAELLVMDDFNNRPYDRIMVMNEFKPWQKAITENQIADNLDFVVYYDKYNDDYKIQCVPPKEGSFNMKKPLPKEWAGVTNHELTKMVGVEMVFCHPGRFIGGFKHIEDLPTIIKYIYEGGQK